MSRSKLGKKKNTVLIYYLKNKNLIKKVIARQEEFIIPLLVNSAWEIPL